MPYKDKQKQLEYKKKWNQTFYLKNKEAEKIRIYERKKKIALWFDTYKSSLSCQQCGEKTSSCLDFHHLSAQRKDFQLGNVKYWGWGKERIKKEIVKCIVLCANCHRKVHAGLIHFDN